MYYLEAAIQFPERNIPLNMTLLILKETFQEEKFVIDQNLRERS